MAFFQRVLHFFLTLCAICIVAYYSVDTWGVFWATFIAIAFATPFNYFLLWVTEPELFSKLKQLLSFVSKEEQEPYFADDNNSHISFSLICIIGLFLVVSLFGYNISLGDITSSKKQAVTATFSGYIMLQIILHFIAAILRNMYK